MTSADNTETMGLREYLLSLWARKFIILIVFVLAIVLTLAYCAVATKSYTGTSEILLTPTLSPTLLEANGGLTQNQLVDVPSDIQVIESAVLRGQVSQTVPRAPSPTAAQIGTTDAVQISVASSNAKTAAEAANLYAEKYISYERKQTLQVLNAGIALVTSHLNTVRLAIANLETKMSASTNEVIVAGDQSQLNILNEEEATQQDQLANYQDFAGTGNGTASGQIISYATVPQKPSSPKTVEWTVIAALIGLILGLGLAMLVEAVAGERRRV